MYRIESCYFALRQDVRYPRMAKVLEHTARVNAPRFEARVREIAAPTSATGAFRAGRNGLATNTDKLEEWNRVVQASTDGDHLVLLDADMMVMSDLAPAFDEPFDVAYTTKPEPGHKLPFNGGTVLMRVGPAARAFMAKWTALNAELYCDVERHRPYRAKYGGMNQASLGMMLDEALVPDGCHLAEVPCRRWNSCDEAYWRNWREAAVVHVKSKLRNTVFSRRWAQSARMRWADPPGRNTNRHAAIYELSQLWHQYEREARRGATA